MTRAKRFEGIELHSTRWHSERKRAVWLDMDAAECRLREILAGSGFVVHTTFTYDPFKVGYSVVLTLHKEHMEPLKFEEPDVVFPSEHLLAQMCLFAGPKL